MSETPRTDAEASNGSLCDQCVTADFARQLERELAEVREDAMDHKRMLQSLSKTQALERAELNRSFEYIIKQRDMLVNILTDVINEDGTPKSIDRAAIFLTAVKGGSDE